LDFAGQIEGTKKPAGLAPCGLSGLHRMTLVITNGEFWWSWRELNQRPKFIIILIINDLLESDFTAALLRRFLCPGAVV